MAASHGRIALRAARLTCCRTAYWGLLYARPPVVFGPLRSIPEMRCTFVDVLQRSTHPVLTCVALHCNVN